MQELKDKLSQKNSNLSEIVSALIPMLDESNPEHQMHWLRSELDGYEKAIQYYLRPALVESHHGYLPVAGSVGRQTRGAIKVLREDGSHQDIEHEIAKRERFFVSLPLGEIHRLASLPGEMSVMELPELSEYLGECAGKPIVFVCEKSELERILRGMRMQLEVFLDMTMNPEKLERFRQGQKRAREDK